VIDNSTILTFLKDLENNRIEILNQGGLYGKARPNNFPFVNDYRNTVVAEAMKVIWYICNYNYAGGSCANKKHRLWHYPMEDNVTVEQEDE
jgi:hypothetical protein